MPRIPAYPGYLWLTGLMGFAHSLAWTQYLLFQDNVAHLLPYQLVLMGTVAEITIALCEVPTGIVADTISRKVSVIIGLFVIGIAFGLQAALPTLVFVAVGAALWGLGETFISGAREAWIADELAHEGRPELAGEAFARGNTTRLLGMVLGIWGSAGLGLFHLTWPIFGSALANIAAGLLVWLLLSENGFHRANGEDRASWHHLVKTGNEGFRIARARPMLWAIMLAVFFTGFSSEGFDRLFAKQLEDNLHFPGTLPDVVWMAILASIPALLAAIGSAWISRSRAVRENRVAVTLLATIHATLMVAMLGFALAGQFWLGALCLVVGRVLRRIDTPLIQAWTNAQAEPQVRATILSFQSQAHSVGEMIGGPLSAAITALYGVRVALTAAGVLVIPTVVTLLGARKRMDQETPATDKA
ncbi:MAG: MFS transporter [Fimbriimonadaceae bacterium]|nr:MFS transporter [Fimbriimonadaceae bacterium]